MLKQRNQNTSDNRNSFQKLNGNFDQFPQLRRIFYISKSVQSAGLHKTLGFRKFEDKSERMRAVGNFCQFSASVLPAAASLSRDSNLVDKGQNDISYE